MANKRTTKRTWGNKRKTWGGFWEYFIGNSKEEPSNTENPLISQSQQVQPPQQALPSAKGGNRKTKRRSNKK
jgi:hypothetical protein